jgi:multiple sugar transport system ATP-binding protein
MSNVTLNHVSKVYPGGVKAVDDLSLEIQDKEFLVLVGPSGCGKTTTLRMVAGLEDITDGELLFDDTQINNIPAKSRDLAMVFQNYALYPHMTVFDNMSFSLKISRLPKQQIKDRVKKTASLLGIEDLLSRRPKELSGGQMQRVALGRAIVRNPKAFLMDEPLSNLDAKLRAHMRAELIKLHRSLQTTFIYVTHDQAEAMTMGTRIAVMHEGLLQQVDTPVRLYDHPVNMFVAGFIGIPQMNFFPARLERTDDGFSCVFGEIRLPLDNATGSRLMDEKHTGCEVIMGIRPEDIHIDKDFLLRYPQNAFTAQMDMSEMMGAETLVHLNIQGKDAVAKTARFSSQPGAAVTVAFDTSRIHLFDPGTQNTILEAL